ncbi:MAG: GTP-binding protein [Elainellaceae cyanobacterium]
MELLRLVVTGTPGAGKSTFVRSVSSIGAVDTDRTATDSTAEIKSKTTVAFDFGRVTVGSGLELHVYGTPGQSRFNFMWDILIRRAHAYILLIAAHRPHEFGKALQIRAFMNEHAPSIPMVIGMTHLDRPGACDPEEIMLRLGFFDRNNRPPMVAVNAGDRASANQAINVLLLALLMYRHQLQSQATTSPEPRLRSRLGPQAMMMR